MQPGNLIPGALSCSLGRLSDTAVSAQTSETAERQGPRGQESLNLSEALYSGKPSYVSQARLRSTWWVGGEVRGGMRGGMRGGAGGPTRLGGE